MDKESYPAAEAARILGVSIPTLKSMVADGDLESFKTTGGHLRILAESLEAFQHGNSNHPNRRTVQPSTVLTNRRERVEELGLEAQELRAKREIAKLRAEEEAEEQRRRDELEARQHEAELDAEAEARERDRWRREQDKERERREQQRQLAEFHSRWLKKTTEILSDPKFAWLGGPHRKELLKAVENEIRDRQPEEEPCMEEVIRQTITVTAAPWYAEWKWSETLQEAAGRALYSLPYGATDADKVRASAAIREALKGLPRNVGDFELRAAISEAIEPVRQAIGKRNLTQRLIIWAVLELPWSRTDSDERRIRRECAEILAELPDDVSEEDAREALEEGIQDSTEEIEERKARDERKRKKVSLIQQGLSEVSSYLLRLRHEDAIPSEEYWDSEFREDISEAVKHALEEELSGQESARDVKELVHEIIDTELE